MPHHAKCSACSASTWPTTSLPVSDTEVQGSVSKFDVGAKAGLAVLLPGNGALEALLCLELTVIDVVVYCAKSTNGCHRKYQHHPALCARYIGLPAVRRVGGFTSSLYKRSLQNFSVAVSK